MSFLTVSPASFGRRQLLLWLAALRCFSLSADFRLGVHQARALLSFDSPALSTSGYDQTLTLNHFSLERR